MLDFKLLLGLTPLDTIRGDKERVYESYDTYGEWMSDAGNEEVRQI